MESQEKRLIEIKNWLKQRDEIATKEIMAKFNVSFDTARRDIIHLVETGQAIRVHGGIMNIKDTGTIDYNGRTHIQSPIKRKMARRAARYIKAGGLYFLGPSTTITLISQAIAGINTTVVTDSIDNAEMLLREDLPRVELLGGRINKENHYLYSLNSLQEIQNYAFDLAIIGAAAIKKGSIYLVNEDDAMINRQVVKQASQVLVVAENYKFHTHIVAPYRVMSCQKIDILVTDKPLAKQYQPFFKPNVRIKTVSK